MVYDAQHALEHPETAGWALGTLDPEDAAAFSEHLQSCEQCQGEVANFPRVAGSLPLAAPSAEPPDDLFYKTMAAVQYAVMAESQPATEHEPTARGPAARALRPGGARGDGGRVYRRPAVEDHRPGRAGLVRSPDAGRRAAPGSRPGPQ